MTKAVVVVSLLMVCAGADGLAAQEEVREFSCAAFPAPVSEAWLYEQFGTANVVSDSIIGSDDGPFLGSVVYSDSENRVDVAWTDVETREAAQWIRVTGEGIWRTANGFGIGSDLRSVERSNGWPFRLRGFLGEGIIGGRVESWGDGVHMSPDGSDGCREVVRFQPDRTGTGDRTMFRQVSRGELSSGHPAMQAINPRVVSIWLWYERR